jgi:hypothetical protein
MGKAKDDQAAGKPNGGESASGYFRKVFEEDPKLLKSRSNEELLQRWLSDHPGEKEVPTRVKNILMNVKSVLRKSGRRRGKRHDDKRQPAAGATPKPAKGLARGLEELEEHIDECLTVARILDREGLGHVIRLLRQARNEVVWKLGQ